MDGPATTKPPKPPPLPRVALTPKASPTELPTRRAASARQPSSPSKSKASHSSRRDDSLPSMRASARDATTDSNVDSNDEKPKLVLTGLTKLVRIYWSQDDACSWLEKFKKVGNCLPAGIVLVDMRVAGLPISWVNEAFEALTGYTAESAVGRNCRFLQGPATEMHVVRDIVRRIRDPSHDVTPVQLTNYTSGGEAFQNSLSLHPIWDPDGAYVFSVGVMCRAGAKYELLEEVRQLMPTLCDAQPALQPATPIGLGALDKVAAKRLLQRCRTIFELDLDACLSALLSLDETREMLETFVLERSRPERFDLEIAKVVESLERRLYAAKQDQMRTRAWELDVEADFAKEAARNCEIITDEPIEPNLAIKKLRELTAAARKLICKNHIGEFLYTDAFEKLFLARCCDITADASKSWRTALRGLLWKDYDVPADSLPWLLSFVLAIEFFPRPLSIGDCSRPGNPLIYANRAFYVLSEYDREEVLGRNARFLHGPKTEPDMVEQMKEMFRNGGDCHVVLTNYRWDSCPWQNVVSLTTMKDSSGALRFCFAMHGHLMTDLGYATEIREERLRRHCFLLSLFPPRIDDVYLEPVRMGSRAGAEAIEALAAKVNEALMVAKARRKGSFNRFKQPLIRPKRVYSDDEDDNQDA